MKWAIWAVLTVVIALSGIAFAAAPTRHKGAGKPRPRTSNTSKPAAVKDAGAPADAAADLAAFAGDASSAVDVKVLDSGTRVLRFGELEIEGRLRSPQIVYFLRRVRAEFAAEDLGHRTFMRELSETRKEPNF